MGEVIYREELRKFFSSTPVFRAKDVELYVEDKNYAHLLLHNLEEKGEIHRVKKGWYSIHEDPIVSVFCFKPAYLGLQEALSLHELWEQETNVVIVTPRKVKTGIRKVFGSNVLVHRIKQKYFLGREYLPYDDFYVPVSDLEKTFIDLVYYGIEVDRELLKKFKDRVDEEKFKRYLRRYPNRIRNNSKLVQLKKQL